MCEFLQENPFLLPLRFDCPGSKVRHNHHKIESFLISSLLIILVHFCRAWAGLGGVANSELMAPDRYRPSSKFSFVPQYSLSILSQCSPGDLSVLRHYSGHTQNDLDPPWRVLACQIPTHSREAPMLCHLRARF